MLFQKSKELKLEDLELFQPEKESQSEEEILNLEKQ